MEEKLIEAVRGRTVLYDTSHVDFLKTKLKLQIWDQIAKEIGLQSGSEAKTKWEKLRHSLRDALRRQKQCMKSGSAASTIKRWKFQTEMGFLQPYMANRARETNFNDECDEEITKESYEELESQDIQETESVVEPGSEESLDESGTPETSTLGTSKETTLKRKTQETPVSPPGTSNESTRTPQKQIKKKDNVSILLKKSIENREKRAAERAAERSVLLNKIQPPNDPLYHFFMCMYESTKRMPLSSQYTVRNSIYKTVTDMEANLLNIPQTNIQETPQFYQYDRYHTFQSSPSTPLTCSENSSHSSHEHFTTTQNSSKEDQEEIVNFINEFSAR